MVLELLTLVLLAAVLITKYGTSARTMKLSQRQVELENMCKEHQAKCKALIREREVAEAEEKQVYRNLQTLEYQLEDLKGKLGEQEERNRELQDRIVDIS